MTGGLLQLVATGIDSIFLTSNPSITLFKVVYKRHTNFSLVTRTKQLSSLNNFGISNTYTLQKEADCIHKIWLKINISDLKIEYPKSIYKYIKELCEKYNITYTSSKKDTDIVSFDEYVNDIIPLFLTNINNNVISNNDYIIYKKNDKDFESEFTELINRTSAVLKHCLDNLYNSYEIDASGTNNDTNDKPHSAYIIFFKIDMIRRMFGTDYEYINNYYNYPQYIIDKLEFIYNFSINRHMNSDDTILTINTWVDIYLDNLFYDMIQVLNTKNIYLVDSTDNKLNDMKYTISKFIDLLQYLLNTLINIFNGTNPNSITENDFIEIKNEIANLNYINVQIDEVNLHLINDVYLKLQYKSLFDYHYENTNDTYNYIYGELFTDGIIDESKITSAYLTTLLDTIDEVTIKLKYSFNTLVSIINNKTDLISSYNHLITKFIWSLVNIQEPDPIFTSNIYTNNQINSSITNPVSNVQSYLWQIIYSYLDDIETTPEFDDRIYTIDEINDIMYNEYLTELTYSVLGLKIYDDNFNLIVYDTSGVGVTIEQSNSIIYTTSELFLKINMMYLSFILIYIVEAAIPNNKNLVDKNKNYLGNIYNTSKYYGYKMIDYFNEIIESNSNPLIPILNFTDVDIETSDYKLLDTYIILNKFLNSSNILYNENSFTDTFVYSLTQTLKQNLFSNMHILYNSILDNILTSSRHNITQTTRILDGTDYVYKNTNGTLLTTDETDYYKFSFFKTFTNNISDTNKFTPIVGSKLIGLSDNFTDLFKPFQQNKNIYTVYFADDILNKVNKLNFDISKYYENSFFSTYFNDITVWQKLAMGSSETRGILQNLTFDKDTGNIVNMSYYFDASGLHLRAQDPTGSDTDPSGTHYINPGNNIYDKFVLTLNTLIINNLVFLNLIPLHTIRDFADEIYNVIKYEAETVSTDFIYIKEYLYLFDFRDITDYLVTDTYDISGVYNKDYEYIQKIITNNMIFKYDLYREVILKVMLRINRDKDATNGIATKDFAVQIFNGDIFKFADSEYLFQFTNTYLTENNMAIMSLLRPENLINISKDFESDILISKPEYDNSGNVKTTYVQKDLYSPMIRGIIERYRIKFLKIVNNTFDLSGNPIDISGNSIGSDGVVQLKKFINKVLDNYVKFDNVKNIDNDNYSYNSYKSNGYSFNYIDFESANVVIDSTNTGIGNINNLKIYKQKKNDYVQASSSIYSYLNKLMIRDYNGIFNNLILSDTYYTENMGQNMLKMYYFIKSQFTDSSGNNLQFYQNNQVQYFYSYKFTDTTLNSSVIDIYDSSTLSENAIVLDNSTYPIDTYGLNYYAFGDNIILQYNNGYYEVSVQQDVLYHTIYDPYFSNMTTLDYEYFFIMSFLGYDIRLSKPYDEIISTNDYVYKVPQYTQYYSNLLRMRNKFFKNDDIKLLSLSEVIDKLNDYTSGEYEYYSEAEAKIADRVKTKILDKYKLFYDIVDGSGNIAIEKLSINEFINQYDNSGNPFEKLYNISGMVIVTESGGIVTDEPSPSTSYNVYNQSYNMKDNLPTSYINDILTMFNTVKEYTLKNIYNDKYKTRMYNNYSYKSDILKFMLTYLINNTSIDFYYKKIEPLIINYNTSVTDYIKTTKYDYYKSIIEITKTRSSDITINNTDTIKFEKDIPFIEDLYLIPDYFTQTDIIYHGSDLDSMFRNITNNTPVKYCWVAELGQYLLENLSLHFDELLIDELNSNLRSLLHKIQDSSSHERGYNIMMGNTEYLTTYDENNKGNITLRIPLEFYFHKEASLAMPMINLLYTKANIKFKIRNLEDLLIYDTNANITKKPKLKSSLDIQYIYLEEEERKRIAGSKMEFLIEKFRNGGIYNYNYDSIVDGKIKTQLKFADPTKYIVWRLKVKYQSEMQNNYTWNKNGYNTYTYDPSKLTNYINNKTVKNIKVYFNGSTREQGKSDLFNTINPYMRFCGSLENDEYMYIFSLYPLLYQPTGTANLSNIEDVIVEFELIQDFIDKLNTEGLMLEIEYWALGYNVLRFISGMCAPIFYI
jgi:hypothetical protein